jgi:hypothetical protein
VVEHLTGWFGSRVHVELVRDRLVQREVLRTDTRRRLSLLPRTRHPAARANIAAGVRQPVHELLTGQRDRRHADSDHVVVAALAEPVEAVTVLIETRQRCSALTRSRSLAHESPVLADVIDAVRHRRIVGVPTLPAAVR